MSDSEDADYIFQVEDALRKAEAERDRYREVLEKIANQPWDSIDDDSIKWAREALSAKVTGEGER